MEAITKPLRRVWLNGARVVADRIACGNCGNFASIRGNFSWQGEWYVCRFCGKDYKEAK